MSIRNRFAVVAVVIGICGFAVAWYLAMTSDDAELARRFLKESPELQQKFGYLKAPMLTGFRITTGKAYFTFWVETAKGREFVTLIVDKSDQHPIVRPLD